ncbi:zinc ribbon domain-containing protein [Clostridium sp. 19966]|uniref:zinc ribbon domain-containing protein n=1 Tax=Clostridium sp. 19966 TaxID=2768166 RepID=UPI0028DE058D|nr:zinc ribbon domain-containing protein [Clostridium sp. 19966]MDT8716221.1 zinc ribbon domain-containing protein [Clostridium sp. 19966]
MSKLICQSCGMSISEEKFFGKNADGSKNEDYCCYCYPNGEFSKDETIEQMVESCIPFMIKDGECSDEETARSLLMEFIPNLKRWKKN